jgi:hypothetical protein
MIGAIVSADPSPTINIIGYSQGGPASYTWARNATAEFRQRIFRISTIDSPLGGVEPGGVPTLSSFICNPVVTNMENTLSVNLWLHAIDLVDISVVDNQNDYIINGTTCISCGGSAIGRGLLFVKANPPSWIQLPPTLNRVSQQDLIGVSVCPRTAIDPLELIGANHGTILGDYLCTDAYSSVGAPLSKFASRLVVPGPIWQVRHSEDSWAILPTSGAPTPRAGFSTIWTGSEMIVWGGVEDRSSYQCAVNPYHVCNDGAAYNTVTNTWTPVVGPGAPSPRLAHAAVWTGTEMIVWGGSNGYYPYPGVEVDLDDGGRYNPASQSVSGICYSGSPER